MMYDVCITCMILYSTHPLVMFMLDQQGSSELFGFVG